MFSSSTQDPTLETGSSYWDEGGHPDFLLSVNDQMLQVREKLLDVAGTRRPIVLRGEKGLGKEALAHTIHQRSPRAGGPFVRVNCYVIPKAHLAAELFGQSGDAVTPFDRARGGSLFLTGIETFDLSVCSRLASTVAQLDREPPAEAPRLIFSSEEVELDGPCKKVLEAVIQERAGLEVTLLPLRKRPEDIALLSQHLLQLYAPFYSSRIRQMRSSMIDLFKSYPWPGNLREVERVIRRFLVLEDESAIRRELEEKVQQRTGEAREEDEFRPGMKLSEIGKLAAHRAEARAIRRVLEQTRWNKKAAAMELGISYKSLLSKVREYRLDT